MYNPNYLDTPLGRHHLYGENATFPTYRRGRHHHHLPLSAPPLYSQGFHPAIASQGSDRLTRLLPMQVTPPSSPCPSSSLSSSSCTCSECADRRNRTLLGSSLLMESGPRGMDVPPREGTFGRSASVNFGMPNYHHQQAGPSGHFPQPNQPFVSPPINSGGFTNNNHFYANGAALALNLQNPGTYWVDLRADIEVGGGRAGGPAPQEGAQSASGGGRLVQVPMNGTAGPSRI